MPIRQTTDDTRFESIRVGPDDRRYLAVVEKRFNKRFSASPDYVRLVSSTDQMVSAVEEAVREGRRLAVTSGRIPAAAVATSAPSPGTGSDHQPQSSGTRCLF